jgi:hypothetical protein
MSYISDRKKALSEEKSTSAKDMNELEHELAAAKSLEAYFEANVAELREETLAEHLARLLAEKHLEKADVIARSGLAELYAYHIFAGRKPHPSKPKVLALALAMQLTRKEAQHLLYYAGATPLYVRNPWDSVVAYALDHHMSVVDANLLLDSLGQEPLLG